jgi:hypothetical protein
MKTITQPVSERTFVEKYHRCPRLFEMEKKTAKKRSKAATDILAKALDVGLSLREKDILLSLLGK